MNVNHDDMKNILFVQDPGEYRLLNSYMGYIPKVSDKEDLYTKLSEGLSFPVYFGRNWDALCELYLDFYWIDTVDIVIVHEDISKLPAGDFRTYISIVLQSIDSWKNDSGHNISFVFNQKERKQIMDTIHACLQADCCEYDLKETDL